MTVLMDLRMANTSECLAHAVPGLVVGFPITLSRYMEVDSDS